MLQEILSGSVKIISLDRKALLDRLRVIARQLCRAFPEIKDVRVFGSIARGDHVGTSDADVLVVLKEGGSADPLERARAFYPYFDLPVGVDVLSCAEDELNCQLQAGNHFWTGVWASSRSLLE